MTRSPLVVHHADPEQPGVGPTVWAWSTGDDDADRVGLLAAAECVEVTAPPPEPEPRHRGYQHPGWDRISADANDGDEVNLHAAWTFRAIVRRWVWGARWRPDPYTNLPDEPDIIMIGPGWEPDDRDHVLPLPADADLILTRPIHGPPTPATAGKGGCA